LDILSKSLYQNKDIFLRELISNSSDALKKLKFLALKRTELIGDQELQIKIHLDSESNTLSIKDNGIGMTRDELINNLGTIAGSGSEKFLDALTQSKDDPQTKSIDLDIIGKFGLGFYSVFMVADKVTVKTKSFDADAQGLEWVSDGTGEFTINPIDIDERGTEVILWLKDDAHEYLTTYKIEEIIKKYSNFVPFPIFVTEYVAPEEPTEETKDDKKIEDAEIVEDDTKKVDVESETEAKGEKDKEEEDEPEPPKPVNEIMPIWKRPTNDITDDDYQKFYQYVARRYDKYSHVINYKVDGRIQFRSIIYFPETRSQDLMRPETEYGLDLYTKNVMIMQNCKDMLPQWLRFVKGMVDSEDIPLNISRETVQSNRVIMKMEDLVVKKILKEFMQIAEKEPEKYAKLWAEYGIFIKEGMVTDHPRQERLMNLLRFKTSKTTGDEMIGLETYVQRMQPDQQDIFYLVGENINTLKLSPHLGYYQKQNIEVIFFTEQIDNFLMMNIHQYRTKLIKEPEEAKPEEADPKEDEVKPETEGEEASTEPIEPEEKSFSFKPIDVTEKSPEEPKSDDDSDEKDKEKSEADENIPEDAKKFLTHVKEVLGEKIMDAKLSDRLYGNACRLANPEGGMTSSMQRAMRYWTQNANQQSFQVPRKIFEFNPEHPMIQNLIALYDKDPENGKIKPVIMQLFENSLLAEGDLPDPSLMVPRINQLLEMLMTGKDDVKNIGDTLTPKPKEPPKEEAETADPEKPEVEVNPESATDKPGEDTPSPETTK
jgi:molecular chaperone HtpG